MNVPQVVSEPFDLAPLRGRTSIQADTLRNFINTLRQRWRFIGLVVAAAIVLVTIALTQITPKYSATAVVLLDTQRQTVVNVEAVLSGLTSDPVTLENQLQIIQSREIASAVMDRLGLWDDPEFNRPVQRGLLSRLNPANWFGSGDAPLEKDPKEAAISQFQLGLVVTARGRSSALAITFTSSDPKKAAQIANAVADEYVQGQVDAKIHASRQATEWLSVQAQDLANQVKTAESAVADYENAHNLTDLENGETVIDKQLIGLNTELAAARAARAEAEARSRQTGGGAAVTSVTESVLISQLRADEATVMRTVQVLSARYQDSHPDLIRARAELAALRGKINVETNRIVAALRHEYDAAKEKEDDLVAEIAKLEGQANAQRASTVQLHQLQREANSVRTLYEALLTRLKETQGTYSMQTPDARVLSTAPQPSAPSSPNKMLIYAVVTPFAFTIAVLLVLLTQRLANSYAHPREVEETLDISVIGTIPEIARARRDVATEWLDNPDSAFVEGIRSVETGLYLSNYDEPPRVVLVTSAMSGEGKTVLALGLARLMARKGHRVVIVDLDLRHPTVLGAVGVKPPQGGIVEVLAGSTELADGIVRDPKSGADILGAAMPHAGAPDMLASPRVKRLIDSLRDHYDTVIIDAAPVLPVNDTKLIAHLAEAVILAVRWGKAPRESVASALDQIRDANGNVIGVVLTRADKGSAALKYYGSYRHGSMKIAA